MKMIERKLESQQLNLSMESTGREKGKVGLDGMI